MTEIIAKIRNILNENAKTVRDIFKVENISLKAFTLGDLNAISVTSVLINGVEVAESGNWSFSTSTNKLTFESDYTLVVDDIIEVVYSAYPDYSDVEIKGFIKAAIMHMSANHYITFEVDASDNIQPEPTEKQKNQIAILGSILIKPDNKTIRTPDLTVIVPAFTRPTEELIRQTISIFKKDVHGIFTILDT